MAWVRLDDGFPDHPKIDAAGGDAAWLHVCGIAYCARNLTDGFVAFGRVPKLSDRKGSLKLATQLVEVGLWEETEGGYLIHDYLDYNPTKEEVLADRADKHEQKAKAGRMGGVASGVARRKHKRSTDEAEPKQAGQQNASKTKPRPVPSRPHTEVTTERVLSVVPTGGASHDDDEPFSTTLGLIADARMDARTGIRRPDLYRRKITAELIDEDGELIRRMLSDGDPPEQVASFVLGGLAVPEDERTAAAVPWCGPDCSTCEGTAWVDTGNGLAPCPERRAS